MSYLIWICFLFLAWIFVLKPVIRNYINSQNYPQKENKSQSTQTNHKPDHDIEYVEYEEVE